MSDCFDHMSDAEDSWSQQREEPYYRGGYGPPRKASSRSATLVTCKHCGTGELHWRTTPDGWRLYNEYRNLHVCKNNLDQQPTLTALQAFSKSQRTRGERLSGLEDYE